MRPFVLPSASDEGLGPNVEPHEDGARTDGGRGTIEWWYFDCQLDCGATAVINFMTKPMLLRRRPLAPKLELTIGFDGRTHPAFEVLGSAEFTSSAHNCDVRIGRSTVRGDLCQYRVHAEAGRLRADLCFERVCESWRPGAGKVYFDDARTMSLGWVVPIPHGDVRGTLTVDGETREVRGHGYHDHNWTNAAVDDVFDRWYWGRARLGHHVVLFFDALGSRAWGRRRLPLFMLAEGDRIVLDGPKAMTVDATDPLLDEGGRSYPRRLSINAAKDGMTATLTLRDPRLIERDDLVGDLPTLRRVIARLLVNPRYFRFASTADLVVAREGVTIASASGDAMHELMIFR